VLYDPAGPTTASVAAGATGAIVSGVIAGLGALLVGVGVAGAAFLAVVP
jgi:hypothetical protein